MAYALASLGQDTGPIQPIKKCLQHLHIAMQCLDDLDDFKADFLAGQFTYAHFLVEQHLIAQEIELAGVSVTELHRHLYTSEIAHQLLTLATEHYNQSIALAYSLGLFELAKDIRLRADKGKSYQREIEQLLHKIRIKAAKSLVFEIEELEQRLETVSDWEGSVETTSGPDGTTCTAKISCKL